MGETWITRVITKLEQLTLGGYPINPNDETPADRNVLMFNGGDDIWEFHNVGWGSIIPWGGFSGGAIYPLSGDDDVSDPEDVALICGDQSDPSWELYPSGNFRTKGRLDIEDDVETSKLFGRTCDAATLKNATWAADVILYLEFGPPQQIQLGMPNLLNNSDCNYHYHSTDRNRLNHTGTHAFGAYLSTQVPTDGTTWVDMTLTSLVKDGFTHTDGHADIEIDNDGTYVLAVDLTSNFNASGTGSYVRALIDEGSGYVALPGSERRDLTATYNFAAISISGHIFEANDGDSIKIQGKFGAADAGSVWSDTLSHVSLIRIGPKTS